MNTAYYAGIARVWVPGLPSCWSQGKTEKEALENIKDALRAYLETVEERLPRRPLARRPPDKQNNSYLEVAYEVTSLLIRSPDSSAVISKS